jgi:hypothetical protein
MMNRKLATTCLERAAFGWNGGISISDISIDLPLHNDGC